MASVALFLLFAKNTFSVEWPQTLQDDPERSLYILDDALYVSASNALPASFNAKDYLANYSPILYRIAQCESSFREDAIGKLGEIGLLQFRKFTFEYYKKIYGMEYASIFNSFDQITLAEKMLNDGLGTHWSCY